MKSRKTGAVAFTLAAAVTLVTMVAHAQIPQAGGEMHGMRHGPGGGAPMMGPVGMLTRQDSGSAADMALVHELLMNHAKIKRTVTNLTDGIRTVTESDDPQVAQVIKAHAV